MRALVSSKSRSFLNRLHAKYIGEHEYIGHSPNTRDKCYVNNSGTGTLYEVEIPDDLGLRVRGYVDGLALFDTSLETLSKTHGIKFKTQREYYKRMGKPNTQICTRHYVTDGDTPVTGDMIGFDGLFYTPLEFYRDYGFDGTLVCRLTHGECHSISLCRRLSERIKPGENLQLCKADDVELINRLGARVLDTFKTKMYTFLPWDHISMIRGNTPTEIAIIAGQFPRPTSNIHYNGIHSYEPVRWTTEITMGKKYATAADFIAEWWGIDPSLIGIDEQPLTENFNGYVVPGSNGWLSLVNGQPVLKDYPLVDIRNLTLEQLSHLPKNGAWRIASKPRSDELTGFNKYLISIDRLWIAEDFSRIKATIYAGLSATHDLLKLEYDRDRRNANELIISHLVKDHRAKVAFNDHAYKFDYVGFADKTIEVGLVHV